MVSKEILDQLFEMNTEFNEKNDEFYGFLYETNGWYECIRFNEHVLWDSVDTNCWISQRADVDTWADDWDDSKDDHDPDIIYHIKLRYNQLVEKLALCKYEIDGIVQGQLYQL